MQKEAVEAIHYDGAHEKSESAIISTEQNIEALYRYTVSQIDAPTISPSDRVLDSFSTFELTVPQGADFWFLNDKAINFIYKVNDDGSLAPDASYRLKGQRIGNTDKILLNVFENGAFAESVTPEPGAYALQLAYGLFSGSWNGEFVNSAPFVYYYDAIENINDITMLPSDTDNAIDAKGIYSIEGKKISGKSGSMQINALPDGIYIIDGKKTYVNSHKSRH